MEIPLCGHATLAAAKVIFEKESYASKVHFVNIQNLDLIITKPSENLNSRNKKCQSITKIKTKF